jgi:hypothetical protein
MTTTTVTMCDHCTQPVRIGTLCASHYARLTRYGHPLKTTREGPPAPSHGLGILCCNICGRPTNDHAIGRCPEWR